MRERGGIGGGRVERRGEERGERREERGEGERGRGPRRGGEEERRRERNTKVLIQCYRENKSVNTFPNDFLHLPVEPFVYCFAFVQIVLYE